MGNIKIDGKDYIIGAVGNVNPAFEWEEGAVCFADGEQWFFQESDTFVNNEGGFMCADDLIEFKDFQLNTIKQGDYIEASELDAEQKYNDAVEVFELFGFDPYLNCEMDKSEFILTAINDGEGLIADSDGDLVIDYDDELDKTQKKRKLTYPQLMAIGELKRLEIERGKSNNSESPNSCEDVVNKPSHYQFFEGVEVIEIIASSMTREQFKGYCLGNRIKYRLRAGNKDKLEQEIGKSDKYVELYDEHKHLCRIDGDLK